jgi:hypothetical protein
MPGNEGPEPAAKGQVDRIKVNTINPNAEEKLASQERSTRLQESRASDTARDKGLDTLLSPPQPAAPPAGAPAPAPSKPTPSPPPPATAKSRSNQKQPPPSLPAGQQ